jgi:spoIIIJ-associated protein
VDSSIVNGAVYLDIKGDGSGLLIGKKGQTLDALQFLVNKIINKTSPPGGKVEVIVDTENYRLRKRENLKEMALKMSQKAKRTLKPVSFNPMLPQERRIIHLILAEDREVYTKSYGEGSLRRIIVYPRRGMASKRRRR